MTGSGTSYVYKIEARLSNSTVSGPMENCGMLLDGEWRLVPTDHAPPGYGVSGRYLPASARENGFLSMEQATALAWWFIAESVLGNIETRLVEYRFEYSWSAVKAAEGEPFGQSKGLLSKPTTVVG